MKKNKCPVHQGAEIWALRKTFCPFDTNRDWKFAVAKTVMTDITEIFPAAHVLWKNALARTVFNVIPDDLGIAGHGIARRLNENPALVGEALSTLLLHGVIAGGTSLDDNFTLTAAGFGLKELNVCSPD